MILTVQRGRAIGWLYAMAWALAWVAPAHAQSCSYSPPLARSFGFGFHQQISVPAGAPDGTVLASTTMSIPYSCPATTNAAGWGFTYRSFFHPSSRVPGDLYYDNGNMGLAIRVTNQNTGLQMKNGRPQGFVQWMPPRTGTAPVSGTLDFKLELVKLDDRIYSPPPNLSAGLNLQFGEFWITNNATGIHNPVNIMWRNGPLTIGTIPKSCAATLPDMSVQLDEVWASELQSPGMTAGSKPFTVGLRCSAGTHVYVTLTDLTDPGNRGSRLALASNSTASGVRLQILKSNGDPVSFGPDSSGIGNANQWYLGTSANTTGIPLRVQYIATGPVKAGVVRGRASFTLSYQ